MTCITSDNTIICGFYPYARFHLGNKYVWMEFHTYCGPTFYTDANMSKEYIWKDEDDIENDPIWIPFEIWLEKYEKSQSNKKA